MPRDPNRQVFVTPDWLETHLNDDNLQVLDVRYAPPSEGVDCRELYAASHIPGAVYIHWREDLSVDAPPTPNLVASPDQVAAKLGAAGIDGNTTVVLYDRGEVNYATRVWWTLRYHGHPDDKIHVLEGGFAAWEAAEKPMTADVPSPAAKTFVPNMRPELRMTRDQVRAAINDPGTRFVETRGASSVAENGTVKGAYLLASATVYPPDKGRMLISEADLDGYLGAIGADEAETLVPT